MVGLFRSVLGCDAWSGRVEVGVLFVGLSTLGGRGRVASGPGGAGQPEGSGMARTALSMVWNWLAQGQRTGKRSIMVPAWFTTIAAIAMMRGVVTSALCQQQQLAHELPCTGPSRASDP